MRKPVDAVTVVIPVHNAPEKLEQVVPVWGNLLEKGGREYEIIIVDDGSTDTTSEIATRLKGRVRHLRVLKHAAKTGYGACLRTALEETKTPLFFYTSLDYPYAPADIRQLFERIEVRDEILNKQPDLISGCRMGLTTPPLVYWCGSLWRLFWRIFAGLPMTGANPWHGWPELFYRWRVGWIYGVPLMDVNSCYKLFRTSFLKRFPIQSDGDFVHTELVAKATFLTSIMDEVPLTARPDPVPPLGPMGKDQRQVFGRPQFAFPPPPSAPEPPPHALPISPPQTQPPPPETPAAGKESEVNSLAATGSAPPP